MELIRRSFLWAALCCLLSGSMNNALAQPTGYYGSVDDSTAAQLRATLHPVIDDHVRIPYTASSTDTWNVLNLADEDPGDTGNIIDVYKNASYSKIVGGLGAYNREHTWPKSYGFPDDGSDNMPYTDCHHLFLSDVSYNAARGNKPFRTCAAGCSEEVTLFNDGRGGGSGVYPGNSNWTTGSSTAGTWETWNGRKGDVARAIFYMDIRYEGGVHGNTGVSEPDLRVTDNETLIDSSDTGNNESVAYMGMLSVLLQWHQQDPVDAREIYRNEIVFGFQGNRNPFIDHPEWVDCLYNSICGGVDVTPPAAPSSLVAVAGSGSVSLSWNTNGEPDLAGYNVYRANSSGGSYTQLNASLLGSSAYTDAAVVAGTTYFYVVTAIDTSGNISADSNESSATPQGGGGGTGSVVLSEVLYDAASSDSGFEWVELYNSGAASVDLSSYSLGNGGTDYTFSVLQLTGTLAPGATFVVGGPSSSSTNANPVFDQAVDFNPDFQNSGSSGDGVALFAVPSAQVTASTVPIDAVVYGPNNNNGLVDESGAASNPEVGDAGAGSSIERTDLAGSWQIQSSPSPGSVPFASSNSAPSVAISAPANGTTVNAGQSVTFTASASDSEDGDLSAQISWSSNLDGALGSGASVTTSALSLGSHIVTAQVADSGGLQATDTVSVDVVATASTSLLLSEVFYDPVGGDDGLEWVELYNDGTTTVDLSGYSLGNGGTNWTASVVQLSGSIAPGATFVVGGPTSSAANGNPGFDQSVNFAPDFQNAGSTADGVALFAVPAAQVTASTVPMDAVVYGSSNSNGLIDETGSAAAPEVGDAASGSSIERVDLAGSWQIQSSPSPNTTPLAPVSNTPPTVAIALPTAGAVFTGGDQVDFAASASDAEEGDLSAQIAWSSNLDGVVGAGANLSSTTLSVGNHTITATVTDGGGLQDLATVGIEVQAAAQVVQITLTSIASHDGWVRESSESSNVGSSYNSTSTSSSALRLGDNRSDRQYKTIVSFDTSSIPAGATVLSAQLRLQRGRVTGSNPFTSGYGNCRVDAQSGGFGGSTSLAGSDFQAAATATQVATMSNAAANLDWSEGSLNAAGLAAISGGTTQFRLYFDVDDNDDRGNDYIAYYSANNSNASRHPQLVITYQP